MESRRQIFASYVFLRILRTEPTLAKLEMRLSPELPSSNIPPIFWSIAFNPDLGRPDKVTFEPISLWNIHKKVETRSVQKVYSPNKVYWGRSGVLGLSYRLGFAQARLLLTRSLRLFLNFDILEQTRLLDF